MKFVRHSEQRKIKFDMTYLAKSSVVDGREDAIQKISVSTTIGREADGPVPAKEEERRADDVPRNLGQDLRRDECRPTVHPAVTLADFIDVAHGDVRDLHLVRRRDTDDQ